MWCKFEIIGVFEEKFLKYMWDSMEWKVFESFFVVMERFSLLCFWFLFNVSRFCEYFVLFMLMLFLLGDVMRLIVFVKFFLFFVKFEFG